MSSMARWLTARRSDLRGRARFSRQDRWWQIIEKYKVSIFYTAPTAIRACMRWGEEYPERCDLSTLRLLGTVGEPINPEAWIWYHGNIGGERCPIVDTWWQTETGLIMISPLPGVTPPSLARATRPFPGIATEIVDEQGNPVPGYGWLSGDRKPWPQCCGRSGATTSGTWTILEMFR